MPLSLTVFVLLVFAVARVTRLVTTDNLTHPLRDKLAARALAAYRRDQAKVSPVYGSDSSDGDADTPPTAAPDTVRSPGERGLFALVSCAWCIGFWIALLAYVLVYWIGDWPSSVGEFGYAALTVLATSWLVGALNNRFAR